MATTDEKLRITVDASLEILRREMENGRRVIERFSSTTQSQLAVVEQAFARVGQLVKPVVALFAVDRLVAFGSGVVDVSLKFAGFERALTAITGSSKAAQDSLEDLRAIADRTGYRMADLAQRYVSLTAAAKGTVVQGELQRRLFEATTRTGAAYGLTAERLSDSFYALEQIVSKGKVQMEELRGQLGDALPGAFQIAARAMGVTTSQLSDMLKKGALLSEDFIPRFTAQLEKELPASIENPRAAFGRLGTAFDDFRLSLADTGFIDAVVSGLTTLTSVARDAALQIRGITNLWRDGNVLDIFTLSGDSLAREGDPVVRVRRLTEELRKQTAIRKELQAAAAIDEKDQSGFFDDPTLRRQRAYRVAQAVQEERAALQRLQSALADKGFNNRLISSKTAGAPAAGGAAILAAAAEKKARPAKAERTLQDQVNEFLAAKPGKAIDESWVKPLEDLRDVSDLARDRWERLLASMSQRIPTPQADAIAAGVEAAAEASKRFADTVVNAFDAIAFQGASAGDVIKRLALQLLVVEPLLKSIRAASERLFEGIWAGGGGGRGGLLGGVLGGLFGGFFAEGGTLAAGRWGIVGERGPELIGPYAQPVTVSPMARAAGASVTYNIDARGSTDPAETQRIVVAALAAATPSIIDRATAKTMDQFSRRRI